MSRGDEQFPSGEWTGFYQQYGRRFRQDLRLEFDAGALRGSGHDPLGAFTISGRYDRATRHAHWTKRYVTHEVYYAGYRETKGIWGTWELPHVGAISQQTRGGFHVWPLSEGAAVEAAAAAATATAPPAPPRLEPQEA